MAYIGNVNAYESVGTSDLEDGSVTAVKVAADVATQSELDAVSTVANAALPKTGGTMTGNIATAGITSVTAGTSNFVAGANAGESIASGGNYNTLVGDGSGADVTTGDYNTALGRTSLARNTTGAKNTALGSDALFLNTSGTDNLAAGHNTLYTNSTGNSNVALGNFALDSNSTGSYNTATGTSALTANTTGTEHVAMGFEALRSNTTGHSNVAVGNEALENSTTANNNTAVGTKALRANTTGAENVAVGVYALGVNTTGSNNTASGRLALYANTTGSNNTAVGKNAAPSITTGSDNTCIGYNAGGYQDNITTGTSNTLIGAYANTSNPTATGQISIGRYAHGQGNNTATLGISGTGTTINLDGSDTSWAAHSDERLKENITSSTAGLSFINDLRPVTYNWKAKNAISEDFIHYYDADSTVPVNGVAGKTYHGFVAQEMKATIDAHTEVENGNNLWAERLDEIQQIAPSNLVPMLVKAIQELSTQNAALAARLTALEE